MVNYEQAKFASRLISAGNYHTLGVKSNGTVLATGKNRHGQCDVSDWRNIVTVAAGDEFSVGVLRDGTVVSCGKKHSNSKNVNEMRGVVSISAGAEGVIGLTADGKPVFGRNSSWIDGRIGSNLLCVTAALNSFFGVTKSGRVKISFCYDELIDPVEYWEDIISVAAGGNHVVGLHPNGTVEAVVDERYNYGQCDNVQGWRGIVAIAAGMDHTVGLRSDGTVVAAGSKGDKACNVFEWRNIIGISAGKYHTVGLKADGTLVATGSNRKGQCDVSSWKLF